MSRRRAPNRSQRVPASPQASKDGAILARCLQLATRGEGLTSPNPMVGAVVVKRGRVIAQAYHQKAGGPHAEVAALRQAGAAARRSTLYSNLEPCCHFGRTPPCVDAIIEAGVRRVVASHRDPYPLVNGRGFAALRRAGIDVEVGLLRDEARLLNERYLAWVTRGRPFVLVKIAMTLDGRIATAGGESRWITSDESRAHAHRLRAAYDAVMVGASTAVIDDPSLTARGAGGRRLARARQPARVVVDSRLRLSPGARLLSRRGGPAGSVIIYTTRSAPAARIRRFEKLGAQVVPVASGRGRRVDLAAALADLARGGVTSVMIEGGGELIWSALDARLVDKVALFVAPVLVGGREAVPAVGGEGAITLGQGIVVRDLSVRRVGSDLLIEGYPRRRRG